MTPITKPMLGMKLVRKEKKPHTRGSGTASNHSAPVSSTATIAPNTAVTTRDRQLVAVATAHLNDKPDVLDVLVREHLSDFPDNILAAWIASQNHHSTQPIPFHP
jgi:hypothetical protein